MTPTIGQIIAAVNDFAPLGLQESWDNSGVQAGGTDSPCTGVLVCVDCTPAVVAEASARNCNLIVAHHPLLFRGIKHLCPDSSLVEDALIAAIRDGITVYSAHTSLDSAPQGISHRMAAMLGATVTGILSPGNQPGTGLGTVAEFDTPLTPQQLVQRIKDTFGSPVVRCSAHSTQVQKIGICGGSGGEFIPAAIAAGCDAYLTSDTRYHDFVDYGQRILLTDIGHFESEACAKQIFYDIISKKFANFAVYKSDSERNSINYL